MVKIGLSMDRDGEGTRKSCFVYLDAKHDRTDGMKSISLWTYDLTIQQVLMLVIMDVEEENAANLTLFWQLWNEVLQEVSGKEDYHVNPKGWIVDENHANWKSMHNVFGDSGVHAVERTHSCEFHFKQSII